MYALRMFDLIGLVSSTISMIFMVFRRQARTLAYYACRPGVDFDAPGHRAGIATWRSDNVAKLRLSLACWDYDRTRALMDGSVQARRHRAQLPQPAGGGDVLPDAAASRVRRRGDVAVVLHRVDVPRAAAVRRDTGLSLALLPPLVHLRQRERRHPRAEGLDRQAHRHAGIPDDGAGVDPRHPAEHYGVPVDSVAYFTGGEEEPGRSEKLKLDLPPHIRVQPIGTTQTLSSMLASGEIDALYTARMPSTFSLQGGPVRRLFPNYEEVERRTTARPASSRSCIQSPSAARCTSKTAGSRSRCQGLRRSAERTYADLYMTAALKAMLPWLTVACRGDARAIMGDDFWPYGFEPNRRRSRRSCAITTSRACRSACWSRRELFAPEAMESFKI